MEQAQLNWIANFIWGIADDVLRDLYVRGKYRDVILPMTVLREERSLQTSSYDNWKVVVPGDLVLNRFKAHLGVFFAATLRGIVSFHYGVFPPLRPVTSEYFELAYHTRAYRTIYAGRSNGMTVGLQNLSNQDFSAVRSVVPTRGEQDAVVAFVERASEGLTQSSETLRRAIGLLREYRSRVIADVVSGKLDVREAAGRLGTVESDRKDSASSRYADTTGGADDDAGALPMDDGDLDETAEV